MLPARQVLKGGGGGGGEEEIKVHKKEGKGGLVVCLWLTIPFFAVTVRSDHIPSILY